MKDDNLFSRDAATELARRITEFWRKTTGREIRCEAVQLTYETHTGIHTLAAWGVRSNLVNGVPPPGPDAR